MLFIQGQIAEYRDGHVSQRTGDGGPRSLVVEGTPIAIGQSRGNARWIDLLHRVCVPGERSCRGNRDAYVHCVSFRLCVTVCEAAKDNCCNYSNT